MSAENFTKALIERVFALDNQNKTPSEIAQILDVKKLQVSALLAHRKMKSEAEKDVSRLEVANVPSNSEADIADGPEEASPVQVEASSGASDLAEPEIDEIDENVTSEGGCQILVGDDIEYRDSIYWEPLDSRAVPNPHMMIMGESGSGKTYASQCLIAELSQKHIPSIIFDYGQGFETRTLDEVFRKYTEPKEYLLSEEGVPVNPLQIFPGDTHGPKSVASRLSDVFDAVYSLGPIQRRVLIDAILGVFQKAGMSPDDQQSWGKKLPTVTNLQGELDELAGNKEYPNSRNAVGLAARLTTFFMLSPFRSDESGWSWDRLVADPDHHVHILQFRGLEGKTQRILIEVLLWHLSFYLKSQGQQRLRLYCVLDEAHHLSFRDSGPVDQLLREARKFGLGLIFASQQPEDFSKAAFSNSASKLVFQVADPALKISRLLSAKCKNYDSPSEIHETTAVLPQGEALFITKNRGHKVRIIDLNTRATLWSEK